MTETAINTLLTHIALPVGDYDATLAFYAKYTNLIVIHDRYNDATGLRAAWLANARDRTAEGAARFVIVLLERTPPINLDPTQPDPSTEGVVIEEKYGFLTSISHLGLSVDSREEVDRIAAMAREDGCLLLGPLYRNEIVGYICVVKDPDGNNLEFSVEQVLG